LKVRGCDVQKTLAAEIRESIVKNTGTNPDSILSSSKMLRHPAGPAAENSLQKTAIVDRPALNIDAQFPLRIRKFTLNNEHGAVSRIGRR